MRITLKILRCCLLAGFVFVTNASCDAECRYMNSRDGLAGIEFGGPYVLDHFHLNKARTDLREFLWRHWHDHVPGVAEARIKTIDSGEPIWLFIIRPDSEGTWNIEFEVKTSNGPPPTRRECTSFRADSVARVPIAKPDNDNYQTLGYAPDSLPETRLADSVVVSAKHYWVVLVTDKKPVTNTF